MAIFSSGKYSTLGSGVKRKMVIPDGSWVKCKRCGHTLYNERLEDNLHVCWFCNHHMPMDVNSRIALLTDEGSFHEDDGELRSVDRLKFFDSKSYADRVAENQRKSGMSEAVRCGHAALNGIPFYLGVMDFNFMGASMGSVVGERITRMVERATAGGQTAVMVTASGGARMQEGILSLMQMAKTSGALARHRARGLGYIVIMTNPTYGGVSASFATLGDVILAEPGAMIGFAGPRVVQETTKSVLPDGFQTAEFLLAHGLIDRVVERKNLRKELTFLLEIFQKKM
ncbi:MAG: acetyl-CoA carboxylase, carboxyltransferase subunit beta [Lentisphaeria bacterium]|nr:acetyl-CoA carboxylase, carboxyltransferase subunit beta [Lentisphaeria bacterium]